MSEVREYFERGALERDLNTRLTSLRERNGNYDQYTDGFDEAVDRVENFPAADVAPVVHGKWIEVPWVYYGAKQYICNQCKDDEYWKKRELHFKEKYCPNCGAKMDGGDGNG